MEDKYPIQEIKVMEGVYIWKPEKKQSNNNSQNNNNSNLTKNCDNTYNLMGNKSSIGENDYLCHGKDELIKIYEIEFEEIGNRILALFQSNEDMMEFDPNDYDLIQAREENLELIDKKIAEIVKIQEKMKEICAIHPIVNVDIFEYFGIGKSSNKEKGQKNGDIDKKEENLIEVNQKEDNKIENNIMNNRNEKNPENENQISSNDKNVNNNDIITEIEL